MNKFKPCPFCGGEAHVAEYECAIYTRYTILCNDDKCRAGYNHTIGSYKTLEQAIAAWNNRPELTCNMTWHYSDNGGSAYTCSNCGMDTYPFSKSFEHCPHCTAKVVE